MLIVIQYYSLCKTVHHIIIYDTLYIKYITCYDIYSCAAIIPFVTTLLFIILISVGR